ncbi:hypothetical protein [Novosphingopyxis sp.]|uniref:hypothetical protein n=1 Tax=Novosphingopyxis sp. TaxID=2709690 RepID=UPI003B5A3E05
MRLEKHHLPIAAALLAGCAASAITLVVPVGVMENFTASSGLSEIIPQTAPPLGATARLAIAFVAAVVVAGIVLALLGNGARPARDNQGESPMSAAPFRMPRFGGVRRSGATADSNETSADGGAPAGWFARVKHKLDGLAGRESGDERGIRGFDDLPRLHRPDRHPDAPPRRPIFASADLGDVDGGFAQPEPAASEEVGGFDEPPVDPAADMSAPRAVPAAATTLEPRAWRPLGPPPQDLHKAAEADGPVTAGDGLSYADLDLGELVDRLERRLRAVRAPETAKPAPGIGEAADPIAEPAAPDTIEPPADASVAADFDEDELPPLSPRPVQAVATPDEPADDMDEALKAALETLERMNRRSA